jgi:ATP-dependent Clp protease ATP-binding subunit ClpA
VVKFAHNEALRSQNPQVEPEHLLAGLLADPGTTSAQLLRANGVKVNIEILAIAILVNRLVSNYDPSFVS